MLYTIKVFYVSNKTLMLPNDKEKSVTISNNSSDAHTMGARSVTPPQPHPRRALGCARYCRLHDGARIRCFG